MVFKEKIDEKYLNEESIKRSIENRKDIIGRKDEFIKINVDETFPKYLLKNIDKYKEEWII